MRGFVLACAAAVVTAQNMSLYSFSGAFASGAATVNPALTYSSDATCYTSSSSYYYTTFNYTFPAAGVYALYTYNLPFVGVVQAPVSFNLTDLCSSTPPVVPLDTSSVYSIGPDQAYGNWFNASTYTFIVGSSSTGAFGGEIWNGMYNGQTNANGAANKTWVPLYDSSGCYQSSYDSLYDAQLATVSTSGYYRIFLTFTRNRALDPSFQLPYSYPVLTVLKGDYTAADLSAATCTSLANSYVYGQQGDTVNTQLFNVWLTAGVNYTFIATGGYQSSGSYYGKYTITLSPGNTLYFTNSTLFQRPSYGSCGSTPSQCDDYATPNPGQAYSYTTFTVPKNTWFYIYTLEGDGKDLEFFIYNEFNTLLLTCGTPLLNSCKYTLDSITGNTYFSGNSDKFTIVATNYFSDRYGSEAFFTFYLLNGPALPGYFISSAPTAPTAAAPSAAAPSAAAPSAAGPTAPTAPTAPTVKAPTAPTAPTTKAAPTSVNSGMVSAPCLAVVAAAAFFLA